MAEAKQFPLSIVIRGVDRVTGVLGKVQGAIDKVGARVAAISQRTGLTALRGSVGKLGVAFRALEERSGLPVLRASIVRVGEALHKTGEAMGRLVEWSKRLAVVGGLVVAGGVAMMKSFADTTGHLNDLKGQIGVSLEKFQEWTYAAKLNGVEQDDLAKSIRMLNYNIGQAIAGTGVAKNVFKALGISLKDAKGHAKSADQILPILADKLQKVHSASLKASIAQMLMSDAGQKMLPMLADGSKGLEEMGAKARALGLVLDQKTIDAGDKFGDTLDTLKMTMGGLMDRIGGALVPVLQKLADKLIDLAMKYGPAISKWAQDFAAHLPERLRQLRDLFVQIWQKLQPLVHGVEWMTKTFGTANVIIGGIAAVIAASVLPAMVALTGAIYTVGVALLTTPVGWILGGLALITAAVIYLYKNWHKLNPATKEGAKNLNTLADAAMHSGTQFAALGAGFKLGEWIGRELVKAAAVWRQYNIVAIMRRHFQGMHDWFANLHLGDAIGAMAKAMAAAWDKYNPVAVIRSGFQELVDFIGSLNLGQAIRDKVAAIAQYLPAWLTHKLGIDDLAASPAGGAAAPAGAANAARAAATAQQGTVRVKVDFNNLPKGARVTTQQKGQADFELNQGFAMGGL